MAGALAAQYVNRLRGVRTFLLNGKGRRHHRSHGASVIRRCAHPTSNIPSLIPHRRWDHYIACIGDDSVLPVFSAF